MPQNKSHTVPSLLFSTLPRVTAVGEEEVSCGLKLLAQGILAGHRDGKRLQNIPLGFLLQSVLGTRCIACQYKSSRPSLELGT